MYLTEALKQKDKDKFLEAMVKEIEDHTLRGHWRIHTNKSHSSYHAPVNLAFESPAAWNVMFAVAPNLVDLMRLGMTFVHLLVNLVQQRIFHVLSTIGLGYSLANHPLGLWTFAFQLLSTYWTHMIAPSLWLFFLLLSLFGVDTLHCWHPTSDLSAQPSVSKSFESTAVASPIHGKMLAVLVIIVSIQRLLAEFRFHTVMIPCSLMRLLTFPPLLPLLLSVVSDKREI